LSCGFYANRLGHKEISGKVEHIVSGEAGKFRSMEELFQFFGCLLGDQRARIVRKKESRS
jgi:hypothetical protein